MKYDKQATIGQRARAIPMRQRQVKGHVQYKQAPVYCVLHRQRAQVPNDQPFFCERKDSTSTGGVSVTVRSTCTSKRGPPGEQVWGAHSR